MRSNFVGRPRLAPAVRQSALQPGFSARADAPPQADSRSSAALTAAAERAGGLRLPGQLFPGDPTDRLPEAAKRKLSQIRADDADILAAIREVSQAQNDCRRRKSEEEAGLRQLTQPFFAAGYGTDVINPADPQAKAIEARIAALSAEISGLGERLTKLRGRRWSGLRRCEDYVAALPNLEIEAHADPVELPKVGKAGIAEAVEKIRETIARLGADIHTTESAAHPSADVKRRMAQQVEALAERGAPNVSNAIEAGLNIQFAAIDIRAPLTGFAASDGTPQLSGWASHSASDALGLIAWMFKDRLTEALSAECDLLADDSNALDDETRAANIASLQSAKLEAERIEERLIQLAAEEGRTVPRRVTADVRAVLGLSGALPLPPQ